VIGHSVRVQWKWKESKALGTVSALLTGFAATLLYNVIVGIIVFILVAAGGCLGWYRQTHRADLDQRARDRRCSRR
jgi:hypothetical protein